MTWKILWSMIAWAITFALGGTLFASSFDVDQCELRHFKVTAYYSPLSNQDFYYRGNYEDEVILNGKWTHGASWRPVFNGMIAAPKTYTFGTKIYFPGRGIGQVEDRGWAIVEQWERSDATYDRIDIWAGKWEDWLKRALSFGVQYIDGYVCPEWVIGSQIGFDYDAFPQFSDFFHQSLWVMQLWPKRDDPWVGALQDFLIALGYMHEGRSTQFYGSETTSAVCKFQQDFLWLAKTHESCGFFWPQTRYALKTEAKNRWFVDNNGGQLLLNKNDETTIHDGEVVVEIPKTLDERIVEHLFTVGEFKDYVFTRPFTKGEKAKEIRILQRKLQWLWYIGMQEEITGVYDTKTIHAIYEFQKAQGILTWHEDLAVRGYLGTKTREAINSL